MFKKIIITIIILLYKIEWFIDFSATNKIDNLACVIIREISHVSIIMRRTVLEYIALFLWAIGLHTMNYSLYYYYWQYITSDCSVKLKATARRERG